MLVDISIYYVTRNIITKKSYGKEIKIMGAMKSFAQEFLDKIGYELGYSWEDVGSMSIEEMNRLMEIAPLNKLKHE